ncbi:MAG: hypothetical protein KDK04_02295 [Candidatus Competibacteraceae bacterium]|nr:hypothetical protein [Candidatus Competibacteraceae bacterium]
MTDLNTRLAALGLPAQTEPSIAQANLTVQRIEHALTQAELGKSGALVYLQKKLPAHNGAAPQTESSSPAATTATPAHAPKSTQAPASTSSSEEAPKANSTIQVEREQCRVYGGKAALCVESDDTRHGEPTLRIEAAVATAPKQYDWNQKITVQLTREELPMVTATVLGLLGKCECKNHGPENDKGLEVIHQGGNLFVRVFQKGQSVRAIPVNASDTYYLAALCLRQCRKAAPWLSDQGVVSTLKLTVQRMALAAAPPSKQAA